MARAAKAGSKKSGAKSRTKKSAPKTKATGSTAKAPSAKRAAPAKSSEAPASVTDNVQLPATSGKVSVFGGPKDRGQKPDDKLALPTGPHFAYELIRTLNPKGYYCSMRWDYRVEHRSPEEGKRWWANRRLVVTNPKNGKAVVVRAVDYGPHESTGLDIGISPGAAEALGVEVGDEVEIAFADQGAKLGPVE